MAPIPPGAVGVRPAARLRGEPALPGDKSISHRALLLALWTDEVAGIRGGVARCFADIDHPLVDIGLSVAHATDADGDVVRTVEVSQKQRIDRQAKLLEGAAP